MIDIENLVLDAIQNAYTTASKTVTVIGKYVDAPDSFPCVMVYQIGNATYKGTQDNNLREHHARVSFQVDVFSNKTVSAKAEVKELMNILDLAMQDMKFTRDSYGFIPNASASITRGNARYSAIVQEGNTSGTTTTYQIYRS